jgi:hypothetical protein
MVYGILSVIENKVRTEVDGLVIREMDEIVLPYIMQKSRGFYFAIFKKIT